MNLYLIFQNVNKNYDTYDSAIVAAESEEEAKNIHPNGEFSWKYNDTWCDKKDVNVELIGIASEYTEKGVILASFNAG
jgi:hypothetical protein